MKERETFASRLGFVLISAGCAIGLGNVWRFPYIVGQYGGAAFVLLYLAGGILICCLDDLPLMAAFFEAASAIATVGLTLGVTPELSDASRAVLILLMYFGRVGSLTVVFAVASSLRQDSFRYPAEEVAVG